MKNTLKALALIALTSFVWWIIYQDMVARKEKECSKLITDIYMLEKPV